MALSNIAATFTTKYTTSSTVRNKTVSATGGTNLTLTFTSGTSNSQVDAVWESTSDTIAAGGTDSLNLQDLDGFFANGDVAEQIDFELVKMLKVYNKSGNGAAITIGGNANGVALFADTSDKLTIPDGACFQMGTLSSSYPLFEVVNSTNNILDIINTDGVNSATYDIEIWGTLNIDGSA